MTGWGRALRARARHDDGASAVEFALVLPLLLLLVFGIINFGILFSQQLSLNNAVREGARRAVVADPAAARTCNQIITSVQNQLSGIALNARNVQVLVSTDGFTSSQPCSTTWSSTTFPSNGANLPCKGSFNGGSGGNLVVQARYVSQIPVSFPPFPTTLTISSKAVYRCEYDA
jgi:Flp pilus assembly protein TadG